MQYQKISIIILAVVLAARGILFGLDPLTRGECGRFYRWMSIATILFVLGCLLNVALRLQS